MNYADKMERESRLMGRLADWDGSQTGWRRTVRSFPTASAATPTPESASGKLNGGAAPTASSMWTG